jgi:hypothetical protein
MDVAIRANKWGLQNRQEIFMDWQEEFSREIGNKVLSASDKAGTI